ncbi:glycosyltransferase family 2 protein [Pseudanabaena sp. FACHB-1998]|uniref:glycosyltransferase family 2 protein n=1 Tax=Pseudanabaena sp. FACHB-1998 TaxID=2692858 RepID=UPI0016817298|nr:glycosyltransferase family 2 protein [Pseudanabaena sp. FACHB-1998]MBD2179054.1 glycosyltransferase family 2 protein [Pseudanabaena sp. FACHB-1998]
MLHSTALGLEISSTESPQANICHSQRSDSHRTSLPYSVEKPLVSLLIPAYNESTIIENNLEILCSYMESLEYKYRWEMIIVNDGSRDNTHKLALEFAKNRNNITVLHHRTNFGLGQALRYGFKNCQGDYITVVDLDLSYSAEHIGDMLDQIIKSQARIVVASPYMRGGSISNVPFLRKILSIWANRFLSFTDNKSLATLTGMVRVYDAKFLKKLSLRSKGMEINPEIIHKARLLGARVEEIPAHLHWLPQKANQVQRSSSMKIAKHTLSILLSGFLFRPVIFFLIPSLILFLLSLYADFYAFIRSWTNYQELANYQQFPDFTEAIAMAYAQAPHTFFIGGITLILSIQFFSLGVLSMQSKKYFEEIFHLGTTIFEGKANPEKS